jgi:tRNA (guanine37-N1)-methyltransferase
LAGRGLREGLWSLVAHDIRDHAKDRHRSVDDTPFGGGAGMVLRPDVVDAAIGAALAEAPARPVIYLTPRGRLLDQALVRELAAGSGAVLLCGRYEGIDERVVEADVDSEWSIGDFVLSGGEVPAMAVIDALTRRLEGALGDERSAAEDSFVNGLLDHPHYTRPETIDDMPVPPVLMSGNHAAIARWRRQQALGRTWQRRPELLAAIDLTAADRGLLDEYRAEAQNDSHDADNQAKIDGSKR